MCPLVYGAAFHNSHEGTSVGENKNKGCVVLPWCWYYPGLGFQYLYLLILSWMYTRGFWIRDFLFTRQKMTSEWIPQSHVLPLWQWKPGQMSYVHKVCIVGKEWRKTSFLCFLYEGRRQLSLLPFLREFHWKYQSLWNINNSLWKDWPVCLQFYDWEGFPCSSFSSSLKCTHSPPGLSKTSPGLLQCILL